MGFFQDDNDPNDPLGIKTKPKDDPLGILKKKEKSPLDVLRSSMPLSNGGTDGSSAGQSDQKQKVLDYLQGIKTPEEKQYAQNNASNHRQLAYNQGQKKLEEIMTTGGHDDPMAIAQKNISSAPDMQDKLKNYMANRFIEDKVDGVDAKHILANSDYGAKGNENLTAKTLKNKVANYETSVAPLKEIKPNLELDGREVDLSKVSGEFIDNFVTPNLKNAALKYGAQQDPSFAKELQTAGFDLNDVNLGNKVSSFKTGQWMERMMSDPNVNAYLQKENPSLIPAFQRASKQLRVDNPEYGINQVASEVSREVQNSGYNNTEPVFNYYGDQHKEYANSTAQHLYKDDPQSLEIWNKYIKGNQENYIDAPSLFQGIGEAGKQFGQGLVNTFTEPFTSAAQDVKDKWQKEAENISANPQGIYKVIRDSGHALGTVGSIAATGNVVGGFGVGSEAANMTAIGTGFLGDQLEQKKLMFDNPAKAWASAFLNTGLYMLMGKNIFPADKVKAAFGEISPEVDNLVENLASGKITREAATQEMQSLGKRMIDFAGGTLSKNAKITAELTAVDKIGKLTDRILGGNPPDENDVEKATTTFLSNLGLAGLAKYGEMKTGNRIVEASLDKATENPLQTERAIYALTGSQDEKDQMKSNLDFIKDVKKSLVDDGVNPAQHGRFIFEALREKVAKDELPNAKNGTTERKLQEQIKTSQDIQDRIIKGEDVVGSEEVKKPEDLKSTSVIMPEENKVAENVPLTERKPSVNTSLIDERGGVKSPFNEGSSSDIDFKKAIEEIHNKPVNPILQRMLDYLDKEGGVGRFDTKALDKINKYFGDIKNPEISEALKAINEIVAKSTGKLSEAKEILDRTIPHSKEWKDALEIAYKGEGAVQKLNFELMKKFVEKLQEITGHSKELQKNYENYVRYKEKGYIPEENKLADTVPLKKAEEPAKPELPEIATIAEGDFKNDPELLKAKQSKEFERIRDKHDGIREMQTSIHDKLSKLNEIINCVWRTIA